LIHLLAPSRLSLYTQIYLFFSFFFLKACLTLDEGRTGEILVTVNEIQAHDVSCA
jgi:hypothetical protein